MSSSATVSAPTLKTSSPERSTSAGGAKLDTAAAPKPKRSRRLLLLGVIGAAVLAGSAVWYFLNAGYETTDDATIEAHVIEVSPKVSAHVQAVHFDDNYQVKRGDLLVDLDPRDFEASFTTAQANLASVQRNPTQPDPHQRAPTPGLHPPTPSLLL